MQYLTVPFISLNPKAFPTALDSNNHKKIRKFAVVTFIAKGGKGYLLLN
jgi:hypothetical protein